MPSSYVLMDEEEMMYVEGGKVHYSAKQCKVQAKNALNCMDNYVSFMSGGLLSTSEYTAYSLAVSMYAYQFKQYTAGSGAKGADYYAPWKIVVCY